MAFEGFLTSIYAGEDISRPTFFELIAQEQLTEALRQAVNFVVGVYAERAPARLLGLLSRWEAIYNSLLLLLEWRFLRVHSATFGEHFYGLQRQEQAPIQSLSPLEVVELQRRRSLQGGLSLKQRLVSIILGVVLPWARTSCDERYREAVSTSPSSRSMGALAFMRVFPLLHVIDSSLSFAYKLLYLLGQMDVWSPVLHLAGLKLVRHFPEPPSAASSQEKLPLSQKLLSGLGTLGGMSLWGGIYLMQFAQWWYQREHLLQPYQPRKVPPPPPPRSPYEHAALPGSAGEGGSRCRLVLLPEDRTVCPLCHRVRRNPAASAGGYVFCYPCLVEHVQRFAHCPVTGLPMLQAQVRRILDD